MRLNSKRGEVVTVTLVIVAVAMGLLGFFARPVANKFLPGVLGTDQKIVTTQSVKSEPVWQKNPDGSSTLVQTTSTTYSQANQAVPLTFFQKVAQFGWMSIIILLLCIFTPLGGILLIVWAKVKAWIASLQKKLAETQAAKEDLSADAKLIVWSIDEGLATMDANIKAAQSMADATTDATVKASYTAIAKALMDMKSNFLGALSKTQNSTTKLLVSQLKND